MTNLTGLASVYNWYRNYHMCGLQQQSRNKHIDASTTSVRVADVTVRRKCPSQGHPRLCQLLHARKWTLKIRILREWEKESQMKIEKDYPG